MNLAKISKGSGVILNDIKVVIRTGIKVRYRRPGKQVKRVEEIFLLHGETNILVSEIPVGFLERGHLYAEPEKVFTVKGETERINKAMLFYSNKWCHFNYEHLLLDLFPKVFVHIEEIRAGGIKLLIPSSKFDKVILEYLELVGVEKENIAIINDDYVARVDKLYEFV